MPQITDTAVCLRHWDFSETSQTVSLFTRDHGVVRGLAKGSRRPKGTFSGGIDVLTRGQVVAIIKPQRDLATITAWHLEETYRVIRQKLAANRAGLFMADLVHHMLTDHDPHADLFDAFVAALGGLGGVADPGTVLLPLQWRVLEETGYRPELDRDAETGGPLPEGVEAYGFSPRAGGVVADTQVSSAWRVRPATIELLRRVAVGGPALAVDVEADPETVRRANRLLAVYCRELIGIDLPTLRWAFSDV